MPINLELKTKLKSHNQVKNLLQKINAERKGVLNQKDIYYSVLDGLLKLRIENGNESLIYYNRNEKGKKRWSDFEYIKFTGCGGEKLLNKVFEIETVVLKERELFLYDNTRIHLDTVKSLGKFLELETIVVNGKADAGKRFQEIKKLLKLEGVEEIRKSYRDLLIEKNPQ